VAAKSAKKPAKSVKSSPKTPAKKMSAKTKLAVPAAKPSKLAALKNLLGGKKAENTKKEDKEKKSAKKLSAAQDAPVATDKKSMKASKSPAGKAATSPGLQSKEKAAAPGVAKAPAVRAARSFQDNSCREVACESLATTSGYCRLHYIKNWKKIKRKELILKEGKLNQYIEELVAKYPDKYIEAIRMDLSSDKEFSKVVSDLELDEGVEDFDAEGESIENLIDSVRADVVDDDGGDTF
jgi:hypothetical protein